MKLKTINRWLLIILIFFSSFAMNSNADEAFIRDLNVVISKNQIELKGKLEGAFTEKIIKAIQSGIETKFFFKVRIRKKKGGLSDKTIFFEKFYHSVKYDNLEMQYQINICKGDKMEIVFTDEMENMKSIMSNIFKRIVVKPENIQPDANYYLEIQAELYSYRLFFPFNYLFFFITWDFETPWERIEPLALR